MAPGRQAAKTQSSQDSSKPEKRSFQNWFVNLISFPASNHSFRLFQHQNTDSQQSHNQRKNRITNLISPTITNKNSILNTKSKNNLFVFFFFAFCFFFHVLFFFLRSDNQKKHSHGSYCFTRQIRKLLQRRNRCRYQNFTQNM